MFPLNNYQYGIPADDLGSFGNERPDDRHTGVDLYCPSGTAVLAVEDGTVVSVDDFTGLQDSEIDIKNRYLHTQVVLVEGNSGVIGYCEIVPSVLEGARVKEGDEIGHVTAVLPEDYEGHRSMLHFELYAPSTEEPVEWNLGEEKPEDLLDPTSLLKTLASSHEPKIEVMRLEGGYGDGGVWVILPNGDEMNMSYEMWKALGGFQIDKGTNKYVTKIHFTVRT